MKKWMYLLIALLALIIILTVWICIEIHSVGEFSLSKYQYFLENFSRDEVVGPVKDAKTARRVAFELWCDVYGEELIEDEKPFSVNYDNENDAWIVTGSKPFFALGGSARIIIRASDGKILALWHSK